MFLICMFIYNIYFHCLLSLVVFAFQGKFMDIQEYHYIDAWLYPQWFSIHELVWKQESFLAAWIQFEVLQTFHSMFLKFLYL